MGDMTIVKQPPMMLELEILIRMMNQNTPKII